MTIVAPTESVTSYPATGIPLTVAEYFAGIGLFRMGLEPAGWQIVYANDWSEERAQIYGGFFEDNYQIEDIFSVSSGDIPQATLATCSFPCIDLSLAGKREGLNGNHSSAFWGFHKILKEQGEGSPPIVILENVMGWLYSNDGQDFYTTAKALNDLGYVCDVIMLNALSFVPQSRPRLFMVGVKDVPRDRDPVLFGFRSARLMPSRLKKLILENDSIRWLHLDIPEPPPYMTDGFSDTIVERIADDDPRWWPEQKVGKHLDMMSPSHLAMVNRMAVQREKSFRTFFRRRRSEGQRAEVRHDDVAGCLRTAIGGSGKQFLVAAGNNSIRMRTLTTREYARLQGVPDYFAIVSKSERQSLNAFGDAVCVPVVSWLATEVLLPLTEKMRESL